MRSRLRWACARLVSKRKEEKGSQTNTLTYSLPPTLSFNSERNTNVFNNALDPSGPVYITIGDGGNREGLYNSWVDPQPAWSAYREAEYGHGVMTILNSTHTFWEWHKNVDSEPVISDSAYFINPYQA